MSHRTGCAEAGLTGWEPRFVDVLTPKGDFAPDLDGFFFHQTRRDYAAWVHPTRQPACLKIEPCALLAAEREKWTRAGIGLIAAVVQQRHTTADRLLLTSLEIPKLRHGREFRLALGDIAGGAHSFAEIDVGRLCREVGLQPPARQRLKYDRDGRRRFLDCEWDLPDGRVLVLEIDGSFHMLAENWWRDMRRERAEVVSGSVVLRCSGIELRLEPGPILLDLAAAGVPRSRRQAA